jgi:aryl-alcohol dehydrogenase-like predicted oxidoreductase
LAGLKYGIRAEVEESLKQLQRDYIDICMCHFIRDEEEYQKEISSGGPFSFHGFRFRQQPVRE